ncbi:MAG: FAD:protein FMN transferase [Verrucomicrobiales bacterium]|nr:FAD:protein FMN transferase [Verrucomicrobiales bacterium]
MNDNSIHDRIRASARLTDRGDCWHLTFMAMGTSCRVTFLKTSAAQEFEAALLLWVASFEARYSRFLPESLVSEINRNAGLQWVSVDPETEQLLALCDEAHFLTHATFDPTALPLIQLWNWKRTPAVVPSDEAIQNARQLVGWRRVRRAAGKVFLPEKGMCLDLGGIGKEYAVDQVTGLAVRLGIPGLLVDFGQDICTFGTAPQGRGFWHIGLQDPKQPDRCWTGLGIRDRAVATSGDYFQRFEHNGRRYGHILDVRTGYPVSNGCRAVTVIAPRCTIAGILATSIFVLGAQEGLKMLNALPETEGCIVTDNHQIQSRKFHEFLVS